MDAGVRPWRRGGHASSLHGRRVRRAGAPRDRHAPVPVSLRRETFPAHRSPADPPRHGALRRRRGARGGRGPAAPGGGEIHGWPHDLDRRLQGAAPRREGHRVLRVPAPPRGVAGDRPRRASLERGRADALPPGHARHAGAPGPPDTDGGEAGRPGDPPRGRRGRSWIRHAEELGSRLGRCGRGAGADGGVLDREPGTLMRIRAGTSGWSYKEWKGFFYPEKLAAKDMLRYYSERFASVEVNNTFYRMPTPAMLEGWLDQVPEDFTFVLKAPKRITHEKRLQGVEDTGGFLLNTARAMGSKLGPFLVQLPPNFRKDLSRLRDFLAIFPARAAFEFRHPSWFEDDVYEALRERNAAWCVADTGEAGDPPLVSTADWGYLRLRRVVYEETDLETWGDRIREQTWGEVYVFFK